MSSLYFLEIHHHKWWLSSTSVIPFQKAVFSNILFKSLSYVLVGYCGHLALGKVWHVQEIFAYAPSLVRNSSHPWRITLPQILYLICHQIHFFVINLLIPTQSGLYLSHHEIWQQHWFSMLPRDLEFEQWILGLGFGNSLFICSDLSLVLGLGTHSCIHGPLRLDTFHT